MVDVLGEVRGEGQAAGVCRRVPETPEGEATTTWTRWLCVVSLATLIFANVMAVILETVPELSAAYGTVFRRFEVFSVIVFSLEYVLRLGTCHRVDPRYGHGLRGRLRYIVSPMALVDLAAILPFYLPMLIPLDLRMARAVRLFRLFRVLKMGRYSASLRMLGAVLNNRKEDLLVLVFVIGVVLVFISTLMYFLENEAQPKVFGSIPAAMWWGVITLTTIGYGDVYPITPLGKVLGAVIALLGVGMVALPAGMLGSGYIEELQKRRQPRTCPHCGKAIGG